MGVRELSDQLVIPSQTVEKHLNQDQMDQLGQSGKKTNFPLLETEIRNPDID